MGYIPLSRVALSRDRSSLEITFPFSQELVSKLRQVPRAKWDPDTRVWTAPLSRAGGRILWSIFGREAWEAAAIEAVKALPEPATFTEAIVVPPEIAEGRVPGILDEAPKMFEYQKTGSAFMMRNKRVFNSDCVGAGKSTQAITAAMAAGCKRILVVCFNFLVPNWDTEIQKWTGKVATVVRAGKTGLMHASAAEIEALADDTQFCIVHYEILAKAEGVLKAKWDCVIMDESHALKSATAKRSKVARKIRADYMFLLTGTPVLNRPIELWSQLDILVPGEFGSYYTFGDRYCVGPVQKIPMGVFCSACGVRRKGMSGSCFKCGSSSPAERKWREIQAYNGAQNLDELRERLKPFMISRKRSDVLKDLPPFTRINRLIELSDADRDAYETLKEDLVEYLTSYEEKSLEEAMKSATSEPLVKAGKFRQLLSRAKLKHCAEEVRQVLASGINAVVFVCYVDSANELRDLIENGTEAGDQKMHAVVHTGENSLDEKTKAIQDFVDNPGSAFVATIQSAGIGLNKLVAGSYMFFVDLPWTPAEIVQAEGRINRIGQKADKVTYIRYFARNTYDAIIMDKLKDKQDISDKLIGESGDGNINAGEHAGKDDFRKVLLRELFAASRRRKKKRSAA